MEGLVCYPWNGEVELSDVGVSGSLCGIGPDAGVASPVSELREVTTVCGSYCLREVVVKFMSSTHADAVELNQNLRLRCVPPRRPRNAAETSIATLRTVLRLMMT